MNRREFIAAIPMIGLLSVRTWGTEIDASIPAPYVAEPGELGGVWANVRYWMPGDKQPKETRLFQHCLNDFARQVARVNPGVCRIEVDFGSCKPCWRKVDGVWYEMD